VRLGSANLPYWFERAAISQPFLIVGVVEHLKGTEVMELIAIGLMVGLVLGYVLGRKHTAQAVETQAVEEVGRGQYAPTVRHLMEDAYIVGIGDGHKLARAGYDVEGARAGKYSAQLGGRFLLSHMIGMEWDKGLSGYAMFYDAVTGLADDPFSAVGSGLNDNTEVPYQQ